MIIGLTGLHVRLKENELKCKQSGPLFTAVGRTREDYKYEFAEALLLRWLEVVLLLVLIAVKKPDGYGCYLDSNSKKKDGEASI